MTIQTTIDQFTTDAMTGAERTRATYRAALASLAGYLATRDIAIAEADITALTVPILLAWATWLLDVRHISARTLMLYLAALSGYVKWLQVTGRHTLSGPEAIAFTAGLHQIRRVQSPTRGRPHPPTDTQVDKLIAAARAVATDDDRDRIIRLRDIALIETLRCTGLRAAEIVSLRRKQLRQEDGIRSAWVIGKGRKERQVFFDEPSWTAIQTYLAGRQASDATTGRPLGEMPVFARHDRRIGKRIVPLSVRALEDTIKAIVAAAGLTDAGITPHSMRHYFATRVYRITHDLSVTQDMLGHASPVTTRVYAALANDAPITAFRAAFG